MPAMRRRPDQDCRRGISLGTAVALSGAAASPNMGYHTSPATAFLMTLFNVRLGAWLPNPAIADSWGAQPGQAAECAGDPGPRARGLSSDRGNAVYLSDGGHFENLGLYEMVRRRCRHILVVDAGADPDAGFERPRQRVRKIRIDFDNIDIRFDPHGRHRIARNPLKPFHSFAYAKIHYPEGRHDRAS